MNNVQKILLIIGILGICASVYLFFAGAPTSDYITGLTSSGGLLIVALDSKDHKKCKTSA